MVTSYILPWSFTLIGGMVGASIGARYTNASVEKGVIASVIGTVGPFIAALLLDLDVGFRLIPVSVWLLAIGLSGWGLGLNVRQSILVAIGTVLAATIAFFGLIITSLALYIG